MGTGHPHEVANIWELPMSCLDDYHLFTKLKKEEKFVCEHWNRRVDISLRKYNYFLLLIHPEVIGNHFSVLEDFLAYCEQRYSTGCFTTCLDLVKELGQGQVDITVGSALDIFGGTVAYQSVVEWHRSNQGVQATR